MYAVLLGFIVTMVLYGMETHGWNPAWSYLLVVLGFVFLLLLCAVCIISSLARAAPQDD